MSKKLTPEICEFLIKQTLYETGRIILKKIDNPHENEKSKVDLTFDNKLNQALKKQLNKN